MHSITTRIDRLAALASETRSPTPPVPKSVKIELTGRCDFQCFFCASHTRPREKSDMPWEVYTRRVRELRELGVEQLGMFYLGESFLCDWLSEAIRYAKRECGYPYVFLTTNGRLATAARVRECMLAGLDSLKFAVNCCGPAQLHAVSRVEPGEFHVIVRNIRDARRVRDEIEHETGHRCGLYASSLNYDDTQRSRMNPVLARYPPLRGRALLAAALRLSGNGGDRHGVTACPRGARSRGDQVEAPALLAAVQGGPHHLGRTAVGLLPRPRGALSHGKPRRDAISRGLAQPGLPATARGSLEAGRTRHCVRKLHRLQVTGPPAPPRIFEEPQHDRHH